MDGCALSNRMLQLSWRLSSTAKQSVDWLYLLLLALTFSCLQGAWTLCFCALTPPSTGWGSGATMRARCHGTTAGAACGAPLPGTPSRVSFAAALGAPVQGCLHEPRVCAAVSAGSGRAARFALLSPRPACLAAAQVSRQVTQGSACSVRAAVAHPGRGVPR